MARKKKRNKPYRGSDAAASQPAIHHYVAVQRSPLGEWWHEHKKQVRIIALIAGGVLVVGYLLYEFIRLLV